MNYCKTCRRHLNGAVSCPGCGATGLEIKRVQDVRSTVRMPRIPADTDTAATGYPGDPGDDDALELDAVDALDVLDAVDVLDAPDPEAPENAEPDSAALDAVADTAPAAPVREPVPGRRSDRRRRSSRRGLGFAVTGGCAGIAVCVFLLVGNGSGSSGPAPTGSVLSQPAGQSSGVGQVDIPEASVPGAPLPSTTSAKPSPSPSPPPSRSASPSSAASSPGASSSPPKHRGKPSSTPTCFLFICS